MIEDVDTLNSEQNLMSVAFVLLNSELGAEERVFAALRSIDAVKETYMLHGVYDVLGKIVAPSMDAIKMIILNQVRELAHVQNTLTLVVAESKA